MDEQWFMQLVTDVAAFSPERNWHEILAALVTAMVDSGDRLSSQELARFIAVGATIYRKGEAERGWWTVK